MATTKSASIDSAASLASQQVLAQAQLLSLILQYVGLEFIWVASISKACLEAYKQEHGDSTSSTYTSAMSSASRLQLACEYGLPLAGNKHEHKRVRFAAGAVGDCATLQLARQYGMHFDSWVTKGVASYNSLQILRWIVEEQRCSFTAEDVICEACARGHAPMVQWIVTRPSRWNPCRLAGVISKVAAQHGHMHILQWQHDRGELQAAYAYRQAARHSHKNIIFWLRSQGYAWDVDCIAYAAAAHNLGMLKWLYAEGCPIGQAVHLCEQTLVQCDLDILKWLRENNIGDWTIADVQRLLMLAQRCRSDSRYQRIEAWLIEQLV